MKALESTPWSINLNRISRGSLYSPPLLKFSTRRVGPSFLDTTIPLLSKALDECPAFLLSSTRQFLCPWGSSSQQSFIPEGSAPRSDSLPYFDRKSTPLVRPTKSARAGEVGVRMSLVWLSNSVVSPFWDRSRLFHLALCGCFKVSILVKMLPTGWGLFCIPSIDRWYSFHMRTMFKTFGPLLTAVNALCQVWKNHKPERFLNVFTAIKCIC